MSDSPIRTARLDRCWRQIDLARRVRCSVSLISMVEKGYEPGEDVKRRICGELGLRVEQVWPETLV